MNDEATCYYEDMIDNLSYGHRFIQKEFGIDYIPTAGWQIDPFGHTLVQLKIFSQMGYSSWFLGRIDYQDREKRKIERSLEHIQNIP